MRMSRLIAMTLGVAAMAITLAACGSSNNNSSSSGGGSSSSSSSGGADIAPTTGKKGGTINVQSSETFEHLDPGQSYFQVDYVVVYAVDRPLYSFKPDDPSVAQPDLASGPAQVSADGKTVTVKIRDNVKYSPPVNRTVKAADVKYAIERGFSAHVPSGYASAYFGQIEGVPSAPTNSVPNISGIETPDDTTIVFHLKSNFGATLAKALSLPLTVPVPEEYAKSMDAHNPSTYDSDPTKQAFTGPYVISKFSPSGGVTLTRNPNWDASTDYRPAYADKIVWKTGGDSGVVGRQTLAGTNTLMADGPPADLIKQAYQNNKDQIEFTPLGSRYVALNTAKGPLTDLNLRKAIIAVTNKVAMNLVRGGSLIGVPGTHFLTPGQPGFDEAGGDKGFGLDYMNTPTGNTVLAKSYLKKSGYKGETLTIVGAKEDPAPKSTALLVSSLNSIGIKTKLIQVPQSTMYSKFCGVPKNSPDICATVGWLPDFPDGYANLYVPFDGKAITAANNANWPQLNDPKVNAAIDKATGEADQSKRNQDWADADKLISEDAPAVPWQWSKDAEVEGSGIHGVIDLWNSDWNLSFSFLK